MSGKTYQISELAKLAGVTVRTIRYYISQGLLPSPSTSGKFDRYDESYLAKLELIRRLKAEYLPLDKIRSLLNTMSDEAITAELAGSTRQTSAPGSAREYIRSVLYPAQNESLNKRLANRFAEPNLQVDASSDFHHLPSSSQVASLRSPVVSANSKSETWLRYRLSPDIELHVREQPTNRNVLDRLPKLLIELRRLCYLLELDEKESENE